MMQNVKSFRTIVLFYLTLKDFSACEHEPKVMYIALGSSPCSPYDAFASTHRAFSGLLNVGPDEKIA